MPAWQWIASQISAYFIIGLLSAILLILVGKAAFGVQLPGNWGLVFAGFTLSSLAFMAFGYLIASLSPNSRAASIAGQLLYMPMLFLSGAALQSALATNHFSVLSSSFSSAPPESFLPRK